MDGIDGILFQFYLFPKIVAFHLLFLYSTSSYSEKLSKGMQSCCVICILNRNRHSTYIISNLVTCRFTLGNFQILCLLEQELQISSHKSKVEWTAWQSLNYSAGDPWGSPNTKPFPEINLLQASVPSQKSTRARKIHYPQSSCYDHVTGKI